LYPSCIPIVLLLYPYCTLPVPPPIGVQEGCRRGTEGVQEGYRKGTEGVQEVVVVVVVKPIELGLWRWWWWRW